MTALLLLTIIPNQSKAVPDTGPISMSKNKTIESAEATALLSRLDEIKIMDKSNLSSSEKKQLRKEVRSIKEQLRPLGGGVYISVGALILILILLVILV